MDGGVVRRWVGERLHGYGHRERNLAADVVEQGLVGFGWPARCDSGYDWRGLKRIVPQRLHGKECGEEQGSSRENIHWLKERDHALPDDRLRKTPEFALRVSRACLAEERERFT